MRSRQQLSGPVTSAAMLLTGVAAVLPGALLPVLLRQWHLSDGRGGLLMMASWGASTLSSQLVRRQPRRFAVYGMALTCVALLGLAFADAALTLPLFVMHGAGLGIAMTAISIARSREVEDAGRSREMNRLNLLWAAGACLTPALALRSLRTIHLTTTFAGISCLFAVVVACLAFCGGSSDESATKERAIPLQEWVPLRFCLFALLAVGAESSVGGWLTTYVRRTGHAADIAALANTLFWAGLLLSRAAHAHRALGRLRGRAGLAMHLLSAAVASAMLLAIVSAPGLLAAALLAGWGLGPLYPTVLAVTLPHYRANLMFLSAGVGAALFPWLVGAESSASGSLHTGLWVLGGAVAALLATAVTVGRQLGSELAEPVIPLTASQEVLSGNLRI